MLQEPFPPQDVISTRHCEALTKGEGRGNLLRGMLTVVWEIATSSASPTPLKEQRFESAFSLRHRERSDLVTMSISRITRSPRRRLRGLLAMTESLRRRPPVVST